MSGEVHTPRLLVYSESKACKGLGGNSKLLGKFRNPEPGVVRLDEILAEMECQGCFGVTGVNDVMFTSSSSLRFSLAPGQPRITECNCKAPSPCQGWGQQNVAPPLYSGLAILQGPDSRVG